MPVMVMPVMMMLFAAVIVMMMFVCHSMMFFYNAKVRPASCNPVANYSPVCIMEKKY